MLNFAMLLGLMLVFCIGGLGPTIILARSLRRQDYRRSALFVLGNIFLLVLVITTTIFLVRRVSDTIQGAYTARASMTATIIAQNQNATATADAQNAVTATITSDITSTVETQNATATALSQSATATAVSQSATATAVSQSATATAVSQSATATAVSRTSYTAFAPGTCDSGNGLWHKDTTASSITCTSSGMQLRRPKGITTLAEVFFQWPGHPFPVNYSISFDVSGLSSNTCASVLVKISNNGGNSIGMFACNNGTWEIIKYTNYNGSVINSGSIPLLNSYHIVVTTTGSQQSIIVNGTAYTISDSTYTQSEYIALSLNDTVQSTQDDIATFSNFVYTPSV